MAKSKRAKKTRTAAEFDAIRLAAAIRLPRTSGAMYSWEPEQIAAARDAQMRGEFRLASKLADSMMSEGAIFTALCNRLAPPQGLPVELQAPDGAKAARVLNEADALFGPAGIAISSATVWSIDRDLTLHGIAFAYNVLTPREDGSRLDIEVRSFPIEFVRWDPTCRTYKAQLESGDWEDICHGDGRWIVFQKRSTEPHKEGAVIPLALVWMDTALGKRDRAQTSTSHGTPKFIGELPPGIAIASEEGQQFLAFLANMHESLPYGLAPSGSKVNMLVNTSTAWQIFDSITREGLSDAARILLGNDGLVRAAGGNYVKDGYIWGIRNDLVESDLRCLERALFEGTIQVWAALNHGTSDLAPYRKWLMPDVDEDARLKSLGERTKAFHEALKGYREAGLVVDQAFVDALAKEYGVRSGVLASGAGAAPGNSEPQPRAPGPAGPTAARLVRLPGVRTGSRVP